MKRGEIFQADLEPVRGSKQGRTRLVLILQNDTYNEHSPTTIIVPITTRIYEKEYSTNVEIYPHESGLDQDSTILTNQIRTIDKSRIIKKLGKLDTIPLKRVEVALKVGLGLISDFS